MPARGTRDTLRGAAMLGLLLGPGPAAAAVLPVSDCGDRGGGMQLRARVSAALPGDDAPGGGGDNGGGLDQAGGSMVLRDSVIAHGWGLRGALIPVPAGAAG